MTKYLINVYAAQRAKSLRCPLLSPLQELLSWKELRLKVGYLSLCSKEGQFVTNLCSCGSDSWVSGQLPSMLPLPPTRVSSLWSAASWKMRSIIDIAAIKLCAEWAYTTLWTCFSCPLHPPFSKAMCLLVKTGFRCQLYGCSWGASADVS